MSTRPPLEAWGLTGPLVPLSGGHRNTVLRASEPGAHVLKSTTRTEAALRWLQPVQEAARAVGFVVPALREAADGRLSVEGWTCEAFLEGARPDSHAPPAMVADFHARTVKIPQRPGFAGVAELISSDTGGDVDLGAMPAPIVAACRAAWRAVAGAEEAAIHGDLTQANMIERADGRLALLDWDEARRDFTLFDLVPLGRAEAAARHAALAWEVACGWRAEPDYARALADDLMARRTPTR